jgi:hypothetical protein
MNLLKKIVTMMSKEKLVTTINGEEIDISKCRKFEPGYYKIGDNSIENSGDCYLIDNKYNRIEAGQVVYNVEISQYVMKDSTLVNGIISFQEEGHTLGYFTKTDKNILVNTPNGMYEAFSEDLLVGNRTYRERLSDGVYYHIDNIDAKEFNRMRIPSQEYKTSLPYDSGHVMEEYLKKYNNTEPEISDAVRSYAPILKDYTFGLEFETVAGFIPDRLLNKIGLIPLRDGSISGLEYVTVPMSSEKGLQTAINATRVLSARTRYDITCALHQHIGGVPRTMEFILAFFKATCALQDEIYMMFPLYKKYNFKLKNKNYAQPYPIYDLISQMDAVITKDNIKENFNILYTYLSGGVETFNDVGCDLKNVTRHPLDPEGRQKWNIRTRYYIHNLIPLIYGNKTTIEFRIHTPTFDEGKIAAFIFINTLLIDFVVKNTDRILSDRAFMTRYDLSHIIQAQLQVITAGMKIPNINRLRDDLLQYVANRKNSTEQQNRNGDIAGNEENISTMNGIDWSYVKTAAQIEKEQAYLKSVSDYQDASIKSAVDRLTGEMKIPKFTWSDNKWKTDMLTGASGKVVKTKGAVIVERPEPVFVNVDSFDENWESDNSFDNYREDEHDEDFSEEEEDDV